MNRLFSTLTFCLIILTACEQERIDDTQALHPYPGDVPVVFAFLERGSRHLDVEAQRTLPYFSEEVNAYLLDLTGDLMASGEPIAPVVPLDTGRYIVNPEAALTVETPYHLALEHPDFGQFRTGDVFLPDPVTITNTDTTRNGRDVYLTGTFGDVPAGLSVSSKILTFGEGSAVRRGAAERLPARQARQPLNAADNRTREHFFREEYVVFDPDLFIPIDTVAIDSVQLILYTWGEEVLRFNQSLNGTNQEFGDGGESIDVLSWSNVEGGHGLVAGFATDTVTIVLR